MINEHPDEYLLRLWENDFINYLGNATGISQRTAPYCSRFQPVTDNEVIYCRSNLLAVTPTPSLQPPVIHEHLLH